MPRNSFATARASADRDPIVFEFGPYGETFTVLPSPTLGDTFDLKDAPEPTPTNMLEAAQVCARFIRKMLIPEDRQRWDRTLYSIDAQTGAVAIVDACCWITEQVTGGFPIVPPAFSSGGRQRTGTTFKKRTGGARHSKR